MENQKPLNSPPRRRLFEIDHAGGGRAARAFQPSYKRIQEASPLVELVPNFVDPVGGKALAVVEAAQQNGIAATHTEALIENLLRGRTEHKELVVTVDHPAPAATAIEQVSPSRNVAVYLSAAFPGREIITFMLFIQAGDKASAEAAVALFRKMASVTARSGSDQVFGQRAVAANRMAEPRIREAMAAHFERNFGRAAVGGGVRPEDPSLAVSHAGGPCEPLVVLPELPEWRKAKQVEDDAFSSPGVPVMQRGSSLSIAELGADGVRLHAGRLYRGGGFAINGSVVPGSGGLQDRLPGKEARVEAALQRSATLTAEWTKRNGIVTSD